MRANTLTMLAICLFVAGACIGVSVYRSLRERLVSTAPAENIVVLSKGAASERSSRLDLEAARKIELLDGVARTDSTPLAARELVANVFVNSDSVRFQPPVLMRGIDDRSLQVHRAKLVTGTAPAPGSLQVIVGRRVAEQHRELKVGSSLALPGGAAPITGIFAADGSPYEDEVWTLRSALELHLKAQYASSLTLVADSASRVPALVDRINETKDLQAQATSLAALREAGAGMQTILKLVLVLLVLLSVVATAAIATTMNAAVVTRLPELASMVAIGIRRSVLGRLVIIESLLLAIVGAVLGIAISQLVRSQLGTISLGDTPVELALDPIALAVGFGLAIVVGIVGSIAPSVMVRRLDVIRSMR